MILRKTFFGEPDITSVRISPDARRLAYLAPLGGALNIYVAARERVLEGTPLTADCVRGFSDIAGVSPMSWAGDSEHVLFQRDSAGDENFAIFAADRAGSTRALSPETGISADLLPTSALVPKSALIAHNGRTGGERDLYRVDIESGAAELVLESAGYYNVYADRLLRPRLATRFRPDATLDVLALLDGEEHLLHNVPVESGFTQFTTFGFDSDGENAWIRWPGKDGIGGLARLDLRTGEITEIFADHRADVARVLFDASGSPRAAAANYERLEWSGLDGATKRSLAYLRETIPGDLEVEDQSHDGRYWIIRSASDVPTPGYYLFDEGEQSAAELAPVSRAQRSYSIPAMEPQTFRARDGLELVAYLTRSQHSSTPGPLYLSVHGGPFYRDSFAARHLLPFHQHLADRGCAVLSVNFRGSLGYGSRFVSAGFHEYGGAMHDDLIDTVRWAVAAGIADPAKIFIGGVSYGGYASLAAVALAPDTFAGAVSVVGITDLEAWMRPRSVPEYWQPFEVFRERAVGEARTEEGRAFLRSRSPLYLADRIKAPLLLVHGEHDSRVPIAEAEALVDTLAQRGHPVSFYTFPDEGHIPIRAVNRTALGALIEAFLGRIAGFAVEPLAGDLAASSGAFRYGGDRFAAPEATSAREG